MLQMIQEFKTAKVANPPRWVYQYRYKDNIVYRVSSPCCDQFNILYNYDGDGICAPDGGFTGNGDGRCADFFTESTNEILVWRDTRQTQ
ncbi:MAG: hypothetical protein DRR16_14740 [Candidatus Parabeggiatoa sp. nov. 3]|nr:MAG: hypothetical protein DRR00_12600 [Gammaproteobacteria bacterium]RKZ64345.1 MAG: hypothetical protein DRQ99_15615 [Gammaproteobacteria bacterium]RKZ84426.1 MAG: hypothetical protein DRR16_14740 [Gammaproteobacteria bacterium]